MVGDYLSTLNSFRHVLKYSLYCQYSRLHSEGNGKSLLVCACVYMTAVGVVFSSSRRLSLWQQIEYRVTSTGALRKRTGAKL